MSLNSVALSFFAAVMGAAAFADMRRLTIPNLLPLLLCASWPLYVAGASSLYGAAGALACATAVFAGGAVLFARGWLGGGDVKLLTAATLWAGVAGTPALLLLTGLLGGVLALVLLLAAGLRSRLGRPDAPAGRSAEIPVPYGVAIAAAALIVVFSSHSGRG